MSSNGALRTNTQLQTTFLYGFIKNNTKEDYFVIRVGSDRKQIWLGEGGGGRLLALTEAYSTLSS